MPSHLNIVYVKFLQIYAVFCVRCPRWTKPPWSHVKDISVRWPIVSLYLKANENTISAHFPPTECPFVDTTHTQWSHHTTERAWPAKSLPELFWQEPLKGWVLIVRLLRNWAQNVSQKHIREVYDTQQQTITRKSVSLYRPPTNHLICIALLRCTLAGFNNTILHVYYFLYSFAELSFHFDLKVWMLQWVLWNKL